MREVWLTSGMGGALSASTTKSSLKGENMEFVAITTETMTHIYRSFFKRGVHKSELISSFDRVLSQEERETVLEHVKNNYGKGVKKPYPCLNNIRFENNDAS